jgi:hypothetical protein
LYLIQIAVMMFHYLEILFWISLEVVRGHLGCYWDDESFAYGAPPAMCIHLVRYYCDKDHMVDIHRIASFCGGLKSMSSA